MKRIGIVTIHTDFNYGAVLQAVATQKLLELSGYDAEIIDYENPVISEQSKIIYKQNGKIKGYLITFIRNTIFGRYFFYKKATKDLNQYCKKSGKKYYTIKELDETTYDILVAGSDQIWNPTISRGIDPAFFLQFGSPQKRISIASSMGSYQLNDQEKHVFQKNLSLFTRISVRENYAKIQLQPLVSQNIKVLLDPTLLLDKMVWWNNFAVNSKYANNKEKYIVTYFVGENKGKYKKIVSEYARKMSLPVWTIQYSNYTWKESNKKILGASIVDFIALITNAELVITDSFHGVAFSVNMGSDFVALTNVANPIRVRELLESLDLKERIDMCPSVYHPIEYSAVYKKLEIMRMESRNWIVDAIER